MCFCIELRKRISLEPLRWEREKWNQSSFLNLLHLCAWFSFCRCFRNVAKLILDILNRGGQKNELLLFGKNVCSPQFNSTLPSLNQHKKQQFNSPLQDPLITRQYPPGSGHAFTHASIHSLTQQLLSTCYVQVLS